LPGIDGMPDVPALPEQLRKMPEREVMGMPARNEITATE
jgi:hypothetical protein